jgi:hypothetical protein
MTPAAILGSLTTISNEWRWLAVTWHVAVLAVVIGVWRRPPAARVIAALTIAPVISVGALAWWSGNPFTGSVFGCLALLMSIIALRMPVTAIAGVDRASTAAGLLLLIFGLVYPHFLRTESVVEYMYASPFGLVPCPTLAGVVGVSLLTRSFGSRSWAATIAAAALVYGVIGVAVLRVPIDAVLIAGGAALAMRAARPESPVVKTPPSVFHAAATAAPSAPGSAPAE